MIASEFSEEQAVIAQECVTDLLWDQVRTRPEDTAVRYGNESLSYRELADLGTDLANYLNRLGVAGDDCVGMFVDPSIDLMVATWGILLSGGAYLPLSPEYPEERLRYMIEDSRARVIVAQDALAGRLAGLAPSGTRIVTMSEARGSAAARTHGTHGGQPDFGPRPENLAYIIYTSGSTGKPKGVMIEHRSVVNQLRWLTAAYQIDRSRIVLQKTPMSFDAAQWEILAPGCGATVVIGGPGAYRDPERLIDIIITHGVTTVQCVPTLLQALLDTEELGECKTLTQIFCGGEALSKTLAQQFFAALPECELVNLYGPTECTINSSAYTVDPNALAEGPQTISIGAPVDNTRYHILDADRAPVGVGEIGELYVGGIQLARGYLHRPDLTADRFIDNPFHAEHGDPRLYRTGDLAYWNADGTVQFAGRSDNQIKLRGFRIELDEIRLAIETHDWVKNAAVVVKDDPRTRFQNLIAFIELNPKEAALMDQGNHGAHHQSKASKHQVKAQLSNAGCRDAEELDGKPVLDLPGRVPTEEQSRRVFARKTYRFYDGGPVRRENILGLLGATVAGAAPRHPRTLTVAELGEILRYFGQFQSDERLLPKYGYASPGALYATQLYLEINRFDGLRPGFYYYHPVHHRLVLIRERAASAGAPPVTLHFIGKKRAIEPVYKNNIQEVLEFETGHMVGLFERVLPGHGLDVRAAAYRPAVRDELECAAEDYYLGTFELVPFAGPRPDDSLEVYVQAHPGRIADLPAGQYRYAGGELTRIGAEVVQRKHVIAINQQVYDRSSFGISLVSRRGDWLSYLDLGRKLHHLQANDLNLGFMSSGYSSRTGNDLPSARRLASILGEPVAPSYFFLGGRVSDEQLLSTGMREDTVHMRGPTEMIRDDLVTVLPNYMMPNRVVVLDRLPLTVNGKIDLKALESSELASLAFDERPVVPPRTQTERRIAELWTKALKLEEASIQDDFFAAGGNSLTAVALINRMNREFGTSLPLQVLFDAPTIEKLALRVAAGAEQSSRLVRLRAEGTQSPVFCWPGLGGYPMNLRLLADRTSIDRPFYGVQAHGINADEVPYATIREMAAEDIREIKRVQPEGPYTLWGYSFGARVAFETAYQLEQAGETVENLFLIAPGSPKTRAEYVPAKSGLMYDNEAFVTILYSVFAGRITGPELTECLRATKDEATFVEFMNGTGRGLDPELVRRIVRIVHQTYNFKYTFHELAERTIAAPVTIFKARGDDYSFIESSSGYSITTPTVIDLEADHYSLLRDPDIGELVATIRRRLRAGAKEGHRAAREHQVLPRPAQRRAAVGVGRRGNERGDERLWLRRRGDIDRARAA